MHFQERRKCWTCDDDPGSLEALVVAEGVTSHVRFGCFLRGIPVSRRVGDYMHGSARIVNAVFKRLGHWAGAVSSSAKIAMNKYVESQASFYFQE